MALTPVEVRHIQLKRGLFGYRKSAVHRMMDDIADSFETVWRERSQLVERVEELETEVGRHVELEGLLRNTLVSAEKASRDLKDTAQKEADVIVTEANAEARKVLRDAITEKEKLMSDVHRVQAVLRSALTVVDEAPVDRQDAAPKPMPAPVSVQPFEAVAPAAMPLSVPEPEPVAVAEPEPVPAAFEAAAPYEAPAAEAFADETVASDGHVDGVEETAEGDGAMADWPIGGRAPEPPPFQLPSVPESTGEIRKLAG
jgi:cell division initiation protein